MKQPKRKTRKQKIAESKLHRRLRIPKKLIDELNAMNDQAENAKLKRERGRI